MDPDKRATLLAAMEQDPAGQRALDALFEAWETRTKASAAESKEDRNLARIELLDHALAALEAVGAGSAIRRQMVAAVHGDLSREGTRKELDKICSAKKAATAAGERDIRAAFARLLYILGPIVGHRAASVATGTAIAAASGYDGPFGSGDEAGLIFKTQTSQGVPRTGGSEFFLKVRVMQRAGYLFGTLGIMVPVADIPSVKWNLVTAGILRNRKLFYGQRWHVRTIMGWAVDTVVDKDRIVPLAGTFEQSRAQGLADLKANCVDRSKAFG